MKKKERRKRLSQTSELVETSHSLNSDIIYGQLWTAIDYGWCEDQSKQMDRYSCCLTRHQEFIFGAENVSLVTMMEEGSIEEILLTSILLSFLFLLFILSSLWATRPTLYLCLNFQRVPFSTRSNLPDKKTDLHSISLHVLKW